MQSAHIPSAGQQRSRDFSANAARRAEDECLLVGGHGLPIFLLARKVLDRIGTATPGEDNAISECRSARVGGVMLLKNRPTSVRQSESTAMPSRCRISDSSQELIDGARGLRSR
jgi:hypothetical protein